MQQKFTVTIATRNRIDELLVTLEKISDLLANDSVHCIICDDGSSDNTFHLISIRYPSIEIFRIKDSKGIHYARNKMMERVKTPFAISIDDDIHIITPGVLKLVEEYFCRNTLCAVVGFRIFWNLNEPPTTWSGDIAERVRSFGAGASAWRMAAWKDIPDYPVWFVFYGEEDFASYHLFQNKWEIHYLPAVLVHHRVDLRSRRNHQDYRLRLRRSLRSGWYLFLLFYPWKKIPRTLAYTLYIQIKNKVLKGDYKAAIAIVQALGDLLLNIQRIRKSRAALNENQFIEYNALPGVKLYWYPEKEKMISM